MFLTGTFCLNVWKLLLSSMLHQVPQAKGMNGSNTMPGDGLNKNTAAQAAFWGPVPHDG
jgi:hypothetical protein